MSDTTTIFDVLQRGQAMLEQALQAKDRPQAFAQALKSLWPDALLCCTWLGDQELQVSILDEQGQQKPEWIPALGRAFQRWQSSHKADVKGSCRVPRAIPVPGELQLACMHHEKEVLGYLAVAFSADSPSEVSTESKRVGQGILAHLAGHLALLLRLERAQQDSAATLPGTANILADLMSPLSHELHNAFNGVALQAAILTRAVPEELREKAALFRTLAFRGSEMLLPVDRYRHRFVRSPVEVALNEAVEQALLWCCKEGIDPDTQLAANLPQVRADQEVLARVAWLLIRNAHAVGASRAGSTAKVHVQTACHQEVVVLTVRDNGPAVPDDQLGHYFDLTSMARGAEEPLERAACQGLVRQLGGTLRAARLPRKGMEVKVELPVL